MTYTVFLLLSLFNIISVFAEDVIINIANGPIKGRREVTYQGTAFYAFQQIPYAKSTSTFWRRLADPEPVDDWNDILDATKNTKVCYQTGNNYNSSDEPESEDCLFVNVYTPRLQNNNNNLPVMFYIHGGGFLNGNANFYTAGPHWLIEDDIIVVTVSYRLGPFGFLSGGDDVLPGNFGLKDQVLALKWLRDNIKYFGGNPDRVTIVGAGAGAASVGYLLQSAQSQGLYRSAIAMSGSNLSPWAYQSHSIMNAYVLATAIGFAVFTSDHILSALTDKSTAEQIRDAASTAFPWLSGPNQFVQGFPFTPYIDNKFIKENIYEAIEIGKMSKVPLMIGITSEEMLFTAASIHEITAISEQLDANLSSVVSNNMHLANWNARSAAGRAIRRVYTNGLFQDDVSNTIKYFSDNCFAKSSIKHAELQSQFSDVYFYQFSYRGEMGGNPINVPGTEKVQHGEDANYIWCRGNRSNINDYDSIDVLTSKRYRTLITNFIKTMNPTPEQSDLLQNIIWPKVTPGNFQYLDINTDLVIKQNPKEESYPQWEEIYNKYVVKPYDTF